NAKDGTNFKGILKNQAEILFQQEMEIKMNLVIIEAITATLDTNPNQDLEPIMKLMLGLNKQTVLDYKNIEFDKQTTELFQEKYVDHKEIVDVYWQWKQLILEAATLKLNNTSSESQAGYLLGEKWDKFIKQSTGEDPEMTKAYEKGLDQSDKW